MSPVRGTVEAGAGGDLPECGRVPSALRPAWTAPEGASKAGSGSSAQAALEREELTALVTRRNPAVCSKYEPLPPLPLGNPRSPHLLRLGRVPKNDQQSRPSCNELRGSGSPLPPGDPGSLAQPGRAGVDTSESLLGPPGGSQGVSPKWSRLRGRKPGGGEFCPRGSVSSAARSTLRYSRHPTRNERGACALGCAPFVAPAALECPRRFRGSAASFWGCNSIVTERIHKVWFLLR